ncbi:hypothetical protein HMPREF0454_03231 [Hafnia alvei ATCC 51873]|uniref:Uncharacterized protein n=1 Tax=Hafnia alvei ATCC 51873 TaxID=1002364 RepID=G9Y980_HAFAL|nr:hypothetical protein HMPREF0454_03231 [Hafnia alvei ATCC 51873]
MKQALIYFFWACCKFIVNEQKREIAKSKCVYFVIKMSESAYSVLFLPKIFVI